MEAMLAQELDSQVLAAAAFDRKRSGPFGLKDIIYPPPEESGKPDSHDTRAQQNGQYRGEFEKGKWHGKGLLIHHNGDVYEGTFDYGKALGSPPASPKHATKHA